MEIQWTQPQKTAIETRGRSVLVSAAAGSGKTAVLIERVLRRIVDDRIDVGRFLIVTFTKAAADEMKEKLVSAVTKKVSAVPEDKWLRNQLLSISRAHITTVHAFCASLLRDHFKFCALTPDFRVADETETAIIQRQVMDELMDDLYAQEHPEPFEQLVEQLSNARTDTGLAEDVLKLYRSTQCHPYPARWLWDAADKIECSCMHDPTQTEFGQVILADAIAACENALEDYLQIDRAVEQSGEACAGISKISKQDQQNIHSLLEKLHYSSWDEICSAFSELTFSVLRKEKNVPAQLHEYVKSLRDEWKATVKKMQTQYFSMSALKIQDSFQSSLPVHRTLCELVCKFSEKYEEEKRYRNIVDFNDLEHYAVSLLVEQYNTDGSFVPSTLAASLSADFEEIVVDEYQDTNATQDLIFRALSRNERNIFMVGDVKQSIYGFRMADPTIFTEKYHRFSEDEAGETPRRILLTQNYRSRFEVLDAANYLHEKLMSRDMGGVDYNDQEALRLGAVYPNADHFDSELCVVDLSNPENDPDEDVTRTQADARYIANRIQQMIRSGFQITDSDGSFRPATYGDVVILLRSMKDRAVIYEKELENFGIPVTAESSVSLFQAPEVISCISMLQVICNPDQDIPLAAALRSALFSFSTDDLAQIRAADRTVSFYSAMLRTAESSGPLGSRCRAFLDWLLRYRKQASDSSVDQILRMLYSETDALAVYGSMKGGARRVSNLQELVEIAKRFEKAGYKGLYRFLNMISHVEKQSSGTDGSLSGGNQVRIMSIHKSKGLEFPIVFLADCGRRFNFQDLRARIFIDSKLGIGLKFRDSQRRIEYPLLSRIAIGIRQRQAFLSEELRILYVAMTRAKEKLILTMPVRNLEGQILRCMTEAQKAKPGQYYLQNASELTRWLLPVFIPLPSAKIILSQYDLLFDAVSSDSRSWCIHVGTAVTPDVTVNAAIEPVSQMPISTQQLFEQMDYRYPYLSYADIPSKLTVTSMKERFLDTEADQNATCPIGHDLHRHNIRRPHFVMKQGLTAAERGTALHLAIQFVRFEMCRSLDGVETELKRLHTLRILNNKQYESVSAQNIYAFFCSDLGKRLMSSAEYFREYKFSILSHPDLFHADATAIQKPFGDDAVLFQGVIDCCFSEGEELVLLDFKTDRFTSDEEIRQRYQFQMDAYGFALERITGKHVKERFLYLFSINKYLKI